MEKIIYASTLTRDLVEAVINDQVSIVCIREFSKQEQNDRLADWIENHSELRQCPHEIRHSNKVEYIYYGVDALGESYNITYYKDVSDPKFLKYYDIAKKFNCSIREMLKPYLSPFDNFRLVLDEIWPYRVGIANFDNFEKQLVGLARLVIPGEVLVAKQPHFDVLPEEKAVLRSQLSANVYLDVPDIGGELELWDVTPWTPEKIKQIKPNEDLRSQLPYPIVFKPERGDLLIFNVRKPHAVKSFESGRRITLQSFLGIHEDHSISLWS